MSIDLDLLPLAGLDLATEEDIDLAIGTVLHLWEPLPSHEGTDKRSAGPDVSTLASEVSTLLDSMLV